MARVKWDEIGEHFYETGTDRGMVYPYDTTNKTYHGGVAWNGLTGYTESPSGAEETKLYADNGKYLSLRSAEEFGYTVTAYTYPDLVGELDGSATPVAGVRIYQQSRKSFGFCVRTLLGNDTELNDHAYRLHLVYGSSMAPSERGYSTVNDSPEAIEFSWECSTVPVEIDGYKKTALLTIDSDKVDSDKLTEFENILYGTDGTDSYDAVTPVGTENPSTEGWYERSGSVGSYTYTLTTDTTVDNQKTYYAKTTTGGTEPRLPLPDEVIRHFGVTTGG